MHNGQVAEVKGIARAFTQFLSQVYLLIVQVKCPSFIFKNIVMLLEELVVQNHIDGHLVAYNTPKLCCELLHYHSQLDC